MNDKEYVDSLQLTVNLIMMESNKFIDNKVREYAKRNGYKIKEGREGMLEFNNYLDKIGKQMKIEMTDINMNEGKQGIIQVNQELRIRIIPNLGGN